MGAQIVERLRPLVGAAHSILALGTNAGATSAMMRAGADLGATGENAIAVNCGSVDCIVGPVGIVIPNSMLGEISPAVATAVASCAAVKILVPLQQAHVEFVGVEARPLSTMLDQVAERVVSLLPDDGKP